MLIRLMQEKKWYLAEAFTNQMCFLQKVFWNIRQTHRKTSRPVSFLGCRPATLFKKKLMNKRFSVNDCKHLWTAVSDLGKHLTTSWPSYLILWKSFEILVYETIWQAWLGKVVSLKYFSIVVTDLFSRFFTKGLTASVCKSDKID